MGHLRAAFGEKQREDGRHDANPNEGKAARQQHHQPAKQVGCAQIDIKHHGGSDQDHTGEDQAVEHGEEGLPGHMGKAVDRGHQGIFDGPFPALDVDQVGDPVENLGEEAPHQVADQKIQHQVIGIHLDVGSTADYAHPQADKADRQAFRGGIDQPYHFPRPVALD